MVNEMYLDFIELVYFVDDVECIYVFGKLVVVIGIENGYVIGIDFVFFEEYYEFGVCYIMFLYGGHNDISDFVRLCLEFGDEELEYDGISVFGEQVIVEMN